MVEERRFLLCVVDADVKYPNASYGSTCNEALNIRDCLNEQGFEGYFELYVLKTHEIENLIPLSILKKLPSNHFRRHVMSLLETLLCAGHKEALLFYDLKKGIKLKSSDSSLVDYWQGLLPAMNSQSSDVEYTFDNFSELGKNILSTSLQILKDQKDSFILDDYLNEIWLDLGKALFTWGCGRMRSVS